MSNEGPRPSRFVLWLLAAVSSRTPSEAVVGDILEELGERQAAGRAPRFPRLWLDLQVLRFAAAAAATAAPSSLRSAGHTLRDAARALRRAPSHALFILLILAIGISAATVTFSVVDAVVFKSLPFDRSDEIVMVSAKTPRGPTGFTLEEFWAIHDQVTGLDGVATMQTYFRPIAAGGVQEERPVMYTMADLFRVLRIKPLLGHAWTSDDEAHGETAVVVIGHAFWQRRFGGDPAAVGQFIRVKDALHRIVGILPEDAVFPERGPAVDMWVPSVPPRLTDANSGGIFNFLARVRPGVALPQVVGQIASVTKPLAASAPAWRQEWHAEVMRWDELLVGDVGSWLMLLLATVSLIVVIACFNAANMMLTRSAQRARELAVRASLGASRRQLAATLLIESLMLSTAACLTGLLLAVWGVAALKKALPMTLPRGESIAVNGRVFAAAMVAAIVTGALFGTVPAWQASRVSVVSLLKDGGTTATRARRRWRSMFLTSEIACIGILLVVSTLFVMSFVRAITLDLGFDRSKLIGVSTVEGYSGTVDDLRARFTQIPGVTAVAAVGATSLPLVSSAFGGAYYDSPLTPVDGEATASAVVELYRVTPNYFDVMSIPLRCGSTWSSSVAAGFQPMVVDEVAARRMFGDRDPIGQQVRAKELNDRVFTIVGTVPFVLAHGPDQSASSSHFHTWSTAYYAMPPTSKPSWVSLIIRTGPPPATVAAAVATTLASVAPPSQSGGAGVHVFDDGIRALTARRRFNANLMAAFAVFAMIIGAAGIYAVMASVVAQQTKEIGIRVALGATPGDIRRGVLAMAARHALGGLAVGLPVAWLVSRGFAALFFQVQPGDPLVYVIVTALLTAISVAGALMPARRAARVDPIISLRA